MNNESIKNVSVPYHDAVIEINAHFFSIVIYVGVFVYVIDCNFYRIVCFFFCSADLSQLHFCAFMPFFMELDIKKSYPYMSLFMAFDLARVLRKLDRIKYLVESCVCVVQIKMEIND